MKIPEVKIGVISPIIEELDGPQADPDWIENMWTKLNIEQPTIAMYLNTVKDEKAVIVGMLVFRMLESQIEADELEELIG